MIYLGTERIDCMGYCRREARHFHDAPARFVRGSDLRPPQQLWHAGVAVGPTTTPASHSNVSLFGRVFAQNGGKCTATSTAKALRIDLTAQGCMPFEDFSPGDLYKNTLAIERASRWIPGTPLPPLVDTGCVPDDCIASVTRYGVKAMGPSSPNGYDDSWGDSLTSEPDLSEDEAARKNLVTIAYEIDVTAPDYFDQLAGAVAARYGVTIAMVVDTAFEYWQASSVPVDYIDTADPKRGGHQMAVVGYDRLASGAYVFTLGNSWGESAGDAGFWRITGKGLLQTLDSTIVYSSKLVGQ